MGSQAYGRCKAAAQASMAIGQSGVGGMKKDLYRSVAILPPPVTLQFTLGAHLFFQRNMKEGTDKRAPIPPHRLRDQALASSLDHRQCSLQGNESYNSGRYIYLPDYCPDPESHQITPLLLLWYSV